MRGLVVASTAGRNILQTCCIQESTCDHHLSVPTPPSPLLGFPDWGSESPSHKRWSGRPANQAGRPAGRPPASRSTALWTVGAAVGPELREKEEIDHAECVMLRHDRLRCEPNVGSVREESLFTPGWVCGVGRASGVCVCVLSAFVVCVCFSFAIRSGTFLLTDVSRIPDLFLTRDFKGFQQLQSSQKQTCLLDLLLLLLLRLFLLVGIPLRSRYPGVMLFVRERQSVSAVLGALSL